MLYFFAGGDCGGSRGDSRGGSRDGSRDGSRGGSHDGSRGAFGVREHCSTDATQRRHKGTPQEHIRKRKGEGYPFEAMYTLHACYTRGNTRDALAATRVQRTTQVDGWMHAEEDGRGWMGKS